ncbi:MAG: DUF4340 domain-containing protein [Candidatus Omnitrophota bacterium]
MKKKDIIILGVILAALLGIFFAKNIFMKPEVETAEYTALELSIDTPDITSIEIKRNDQELLKLEKKGEGWSMPSKWDMRAKASKAEEFLNSFSGLKGELRSKTDKLFSDYGISDEDGISITMLNKDNEIKNQLIIGIEKPQQEGNFLRERDSKKVYLVDKDILGIVGMSDPKEGALDIDSWYDLSIVDFNADDIEGLEVFRYDGEKESMQLDIKKELDEERDLKKWIVKSGEALFDIDAKKIKDHINKIKDIEAAKVVDPEEDYGFSSPFIRVSLLKEGEPIELFVGNEKDDAGDRYVKNQEGHVFLVRRYNINNLNIDISKFFIDNPLRMDKDKIESIDIKAKDRAISIKKELLDKNTSYINKLKRFEIENIVFDDKYAKSFKSKPDHYITIKRDDSAITLEAVKLEDEDIILGKISGKDTIFKMTKSVFERVFDGLDSIKLEEEEVKEKKD